jgi:uncharacterized protein YegP (UPF0339 family)
MEFHVKPAEGGGVCWHLIDSENGKTLATSQVYRSGTPSALEAARSVKIEAAAASIWDMTVDPPIRVSEGHDLAGLAATRGRARPRGRT